MASSVVIAVCIPSLLRHVAQSNVPTVSTNGGGTGGNKAGAGGGGMGAPGGNAGTYIENQFNNFKPNCKSTPITLRNGIGTFNDPCITANSVCFGRDLTTLTNPMTLGTPTAGSVPITYGIGAIR